MKNKTQCESGVVGYFTLSTAACARLVLPGIAWRGASVPGRPRARAIRSRCFQRYAAAICSLLAGLAGLMSDRVSAAEPDYNAPWQDSEPKATAPKKTTVPPSGASPATSPAASTEAAAASSMLDNKTALRPSKPQANNEVSVSADYFFGGGDVSVPFGYALQKLSPNVPTTAGLANRTSKYFGATLSYSHGQKWYLDLSYAHGTLAAPQQEFTIQNAISGPLKATFGVKDDWYQAYLRYAFPKLAGKRFSAYLRGGVSYVQADLTATGIGTSSFYNQTDKTADLLGSIGFGVNYRLANQLMKGRLRVSLQGEGEGFYGTRSQQSVETITGLSNGGKVSPSADISNTLYGGNLRGTLHVEYRAGRSGFFKIFADGGLQAKFTLINYPAVNNSSGLSLNELLWGPYVKVGASYAF